MTIADAVSAATDDSAGLGVFFAFFAIFYLAIIVGFFFVYGKIVAKSGYPWTWVFIMLVPIANLVMLCIFAFKEWPIERELAATRAALAAATGSPYPGGNPYAGQPMSYGQGGGAYPAPGYDAQGYPLAGGYPQPGQQPSGGYYGPGGTPTQGPY